MHKLHIRPTSVKECNIWCMFMTEVSYHGIYLLTSCQTIYLSISQTTLFCICFVCSAEDLLPYRRRPYKIKTLSTDGIYLVVDWSCNLLSADQPMCPTNDTCWLSVMVNYTPMSSQMDHMLLYVLSITIMRSSSSPSSLSLRVECTHHRISMGALQ